MKIRSTIVLVSLLLILCNGTAFAYIDPGVGSVLVQVLIGAVIGGFFWFRERVKQFLLKIKSLFK